ncbi:hypothetical protein ACEWF1_07230, partial [Bifidobacterium longum subsp. longum]|uniref:hypothetical protein n=1 Tax=Bifidobacterium longum TaxID=216816 RepID=UPI003D066B03
TPCGKPAAYTAEKHRSQSGRQLAKTHGTRKSFALRRYRPDPEDYTFLSGGRYRQIIGSSGFGV